LFDQGETQAEVARRLKVSRVSAMRWYRIWRKQGGQGLRRVRRLGRPAKLSVGQLRKVEKVLLKGPRAEGYSTDIWTLPRIARVIHRLTAVEYHPGHVWRVLKGLGWSLQRPAKRARERDEQAIYRWKKQVWPTVRKVS
jgi:transposase